MVELVPGMEKRRLTSLCDAEGFCRLAAAVPSGKGWSLVADVFGTDLSYVAVLPCNLPVDVTPRKPSARFFILCPEPASQSGPGRLSR
jgi:hypothetical protein